jgi:EAL domain-containing protein (putative c-di-GMP-specific phosphodiesterase class I)
VPPSGFVQVAEETGLIVAIGEWVLREACAAGARWPDDVNVAVNLSPVQFRHRNIAQHVKAALEYGGLRPDRLEIEVAESLLLADGEPALRILRQLRELGVRIAVDDFGTGYSSLSYLNRFPVDIIKVDQSFTRAVNDADDEVRQKSRMLIESIATLSHKMDCTIIAEGIETEEECRVLHQMGLDYGQGYLFHRPQNAAVLIEELQASPSAVARAS